MLTPTITHVIFDMDGLLLGTHTSRSRSRSIFIYLHKSTSFIIKSSVLSLSRGEYYSVQLGNLKELRSASNGV